MITYIYIYIYIYILDLNLQVTIIHDDFMKQKERSSKTGSVTDSSGYCDTLRVRVQSYIR